MENKATAITGKDIPIKVDSICVHGDGDKALEFVEKIKLSLEEENIEIIPLHKIY
ncbi:lactam utilization protein B [Clostridium beijerinckii]|nr:lactam utilization protein B [Clostridium beijerinckii]